MEIVDQIIEDYKVIDYEYWQDYTLKKRKIWQIERNIKRLRKELGFSNKVKISNLKEEFDWLFLTKKRKKNKPIATFRFFVRIKKRFIFTSRLYFSESFRSVENRKFTDQNLLFVEISENRRRRIK